VSPEVERDRYRRHLQQNGEPISILRPGTPNQTFPDLLARVVGYQPREIVGNVQQGDRKVILLAEDVAASGLELPFRAKADRIVWNGKTMVVQAVDDATRRIAGVLIAYEIRVSGA
jgi:hypothetical protein